MVSPQLLRRFPGFVQALESTVRSVAVVASEKTYRKGQALFHEGKAAEQLHLVLEGEVELSVEIKGTKITIDTVMPGELCCWSALVDPCVASATGTARTNVRAIVIDGEDLRRLFARDCSLGFYVMGDAVRTLGKRLRGLQVLIAAQAAGDNGFTKD